MRPASKVVIVVTDPAGKPVPKAQVVLEEPSEGKGRRLKRERWVGRTDSKGRITFKNVHRKRLVLTVSHKSFRGHNQKVRIKHPQHTIKVQLKRRNS